MLYPAIQTVRYSFLNETATKLVGLADYKNLFSTTDTLIALRNNVIWVIVFPFLVTVIGLVFAVLSGRHPVVDGLQDDHLPANRLQRHSLVLGLHPDIPTRPARRCCQRLRPDRRRLDPPARRLPVVGRPDRIVARHERGRHPAPRHAREQREGERRPDGADGPDRCQCRHAHSARRPSRPPRPVRSGFHHRLGAAGLPSRTRPISPLSTPTRTGTRTSASPCCEATAALPPLPLRHRPVSIAADVDPDVPGIAAAPPTSPVRASRSARSR